MNSIKSNSLRTKLSPIFSSSPLYLLRKIVAFAIIYFTAAIIGEGIIIGITIAMGYDPLHGIMPDGNIATLMTYYGFACFIITTLLYSRIVEKIKPSALGFNRKIIYYLYGMVLAAILLTIVICLGLLTNSLSFSGINHNTDYIYIILLLPGFMIQSAAEEVMTRGFLMQALLKRIPAPLAIFISSTAFVYPHLSTLFDTSITYSIIGLINLYLISFIFSLMVIRTKNLWFSCSLHGVWNFMLYGVFGLTLTGSTSDSPGLLSFTAGTPDLMNGGEYGVESGLLTTLVLGVALAAMYIYYARKKTILSSK